MDKIEIGPAHELLVRPTQGFLPNGIEAFEIAVEAGNAEHVQGQGEEAIQLGFLLMKLRFGFALLAHVARGHEGQCLGLEVQASDGEVDGNPDAVLDGAQEEAVLGEKDIALAGCLAQALHAVAIAAGKAHPEGGRLPHQLWLRAPGETQGGGIHVQKLVRIRIEQKQGVGRFRKNRPAHLAGFKHAHRLSQFLLLLLLLLLLLIFCERRYRD